MLTQNTNTLRTSTTSSRTLLVLLGVLCVVLAGPLVSPKSAEAHIVPLRSCQLAWESAPPGQKWAAKMRCLKRVKAHNLQHVCAKPRPVVRQGVTVKHVTASGKQRRVLTRMLNVGYRMKAPNKVLVAMVAGTTQESGAAELSGGHGTSAGPLQLIDTHGSHAERMNAEFSASWFLPQAINVDYHYPRLSVGQLTQKVQRSGHPGAYSPWVRESYRTVKVFLGPCQWVLRT